MQTFLPYPDLLKSLMVLDYRRLGKQRVETKQLLKSMAYAGYATTETVNLKNLFVNTEWENKIDEIFGVNYKGWANHPARIMWQRNPGALAVYHDLSIIAWVRRGYKNSMLPLSVAGKHRLPEWFGNEEFHASHRSNLLRKDPVWYGNYEWTESPDMEYVWPV